MVFSEESTVGAFLLRARREGLRDFGASMSPHTAWLILQGIETLPLRMARHVENTRKVVAFLAGHAQVARVGYPELESHPDHALAKRLLPRGCGSVFSFDLKGSRAAGVAFIEALKLFSHLANVGDCRSLVIHPASTTHFRMDDAALARAGIGPGTIRLSIGLEDADDLIDDLKRALKAASRVGAASSDMNVVLPEPGRAELPARTPASAPPTPTPAASPSTRRCPRSSSSTARCTTTASGRSPRAGSRTTATACSRSTCRATAAAAGRRWPASRRWPTGCSPCSTRPASSRRASSATAWARWSRSRRRRGRPGACAISSWSPRRTRWSSRRRCSTWRPTIRRRRSRASTGGRTRPRRPSLRTPARARGCTAATWP